MGRARGGAGRGRRTPADRRAPSSGSCWRARWPRRRTGRPCGRGASGHRAPPAGRRCRGSRTRRRRTWIHPDSVNGLHAAFGRQSSLGQSAPSSSAGPRRPSAERVPALSWIASMRPNRSGAASSRAAQARAPASRCPCATGARFPPGRLNGADESGRTRKGRRPAPTPLNGLIGQKVCLDRTHVPLTLIQPEREGVLAVEFFPDSPVAPFRPPIALLRG